MTHNICKIGLKELVNTLACCWLKERRFQTASPRLKSQHHPDSLVSLLAQFADRWFDADCRTYSVCCYLPVFCWTSGFYSKEMRQALIWLACLTHELTFSYAYLHVVTQHFYLLSLDIPFCLVNKLTPSLLGEYYG